MTELHQEALAEALVLAPVVLTLVSLFLGAILHTVLLVTEQLPTRKRPQ